MLCAQCQKREASVFFKKIAHNQVTQFALCRECAQDRGLLSESHDPFADLLAGLQALLQKKTSTSRDWNPHCPSCGFSYARFMKTGRLGCPDCYAAFRRPLADLLKHIHGTARHVGRAPAAAGGAPIERSNVRKPGPASKAPGAPAAENDLKQLHQMLKQAVDREEFEEAARLRDRIRRLEADLS